MKTATELASQFMQTLANNLDAETRAKWTPFGNPPLDDEVYVWRRDGHKTFYRRTIGTPRDEALVWLRLLTPSNRDHFLVLHFRLSIPELQAYNHKYGLKIRASLRRRTWRTAISLTTVEEASKAGRMVANLLNTRVL